MIVTATCPRKEQTSAVFATDTNSTYKSARSQFVRSCLRNVGDVVVVIMATMMVMVVVVVMHGSACALCMSVSGD